MKLIIGLGNPGAKYDGTRHNAGFRAVRAFHTLHAVAFDGWKTKGKAEVSTGLVRGEKIALAMPTTFMNASGEAARELADFWKIAPEDVILVFDDLDLPLGTVRIRTDGSAGGHNGVRSVIEHLGTNVFARVRIGIAGERRDQIPAEDYVLQKFAQTELESAENGIRHAAEALDAILRDGIEQAMNAFN